MVTRQSLSGIAGVLLCCKEILDNLAIHRSYKDMDFVVSELYGAFNTALSIDLEQSFINCQDLTIEQCVSTRLNVGFTKFDQSKMFFAAKCLKSVEYEDDFKRNNEISKLTVEDLVRTFNIVAAFVVHLVDKYNLRN